jgi:hypothetical protein
MLSTIKLSLKRWSIASDRHAYQAYRINGGKGRYRV